MAANPKPSTKIVVGQFGRTFGIKGWLFIHSFTDPAANLFKYKPWYLQKASGFSEIIPTDYKLQNDKYIVKLANFDTPEAASLLVNQEVSIDKGVLPVLKTDEIYWSDLEGMQVVNLQQEILGKVDFLTAIGDQTILVITGEKRYMVPYIHGQFVKNIDVTQRILTIDWDKDF